VPNASFMFHHLDSETKERTLWEIRRVLRPGGQLHLLDFVASDGRGGFLAHLFHSHAHMAENSDANILALLNKAEMADARVAGRRKTLFGLAPVAYFAASAPIAAASRVASHSS
jgi:SAM-dependent methyltransferase